MNAEITAIQPLTFRTATPEDYKKTVCLIYSSGPKSFEYVFGRKEISALDFLRFAFKSEKSNFSHKNHLIGEIDGEVVATGTVLKAENLVKNTLDAVQLIFSFYGFWNGFGVLLRGLRTENIIKPPKGKEQLLAHLGVTPDFRGKGIGSKLIDQLIEESDSSAPIGLDVSVKNPKAESLYLRKGFKSIKTISSKLKNEYGYVASHKRMILKKDTV
ncbi:GNAT family N-acetyltransferase [Sediminitomix flava]|uniref:GNAT family acetyltransferase n=1 Tax=Sediminitomix flava TaxID=379075 RepID=A0A315ZD46_SEDFL|nr:GNAT family N-acetyltransferase [Sediminitomix flava]PWJ42624.1 GNAT family acetyltransferase [Sediminitomix flava]